MWDGHCSARATCVASTGTVRPPAVGSYGGGPLARLRRVTRLQVEKLDRLAPCSPGRTRNPYAGQTQSDGYD